MSRSIAKGEWEGDVTWGFCKWVIGVWSQQLQLTQLDFSSIVVLDTKNLKLIDGVFHLV